MLREKSIYCHNCSKRMPHKYAGYQSLFEGMGPLRVLGAVATLGMSETTFTDRYWKCEGCGRIIKYNS